MAGTPDSRRGRASRHGRLTAQAGVRGGPGRVARVTSASRCCYCLHAMRRSIAAQLGRVSASRRASHTIACPASSPHMSLDGRSPPQKAGRSGRPKMRHRISASSWTHGTPAGLPSGMPGIGLVMDGAMQQAPQPARQDVANEPADVGERRGEAGDMDGLSSPVADWGRAA
jgi:hypothetical protein